MSRERGASELRFVLALYRLVLWLYPGDFRHNHGKEMEGVVRLEWLRRSSGAGWKGLASFGLWLLGDIARSLAEVHGRRVRRSWAGGSPSGHHIHEQESMMVRKGWSEGMKSILRDFRFAVRTLRRRPGFSISAILTFAVGIAAYSAVFSLLHAILIRPLPFPDASRLVFIDGTSPERSLEGQPVSYPDVVDVQRMNRSLTGAAGVMYVTRHTSPELNGSDWITGAYVSSNFAEVLGVRPLLGRWFGPTEGAPGQNQVVLIGEAIWRRQFGGDPGVLGTVISLNGESTEIVGVMPAHLRFPGTSDLWVPVRDEADGPRNHRQYTLVGRLAPGVTTEQASADLERISRALAQQHAATNGDLSLRVRTLREGVFGEEQESVLIFYAIVSLVLLLACVNVAGLLLARNEARSHEMTVRLSLGAGRPQIIRMMLAESLILASVGGALGMALGWFGLEFLLTHRPVEIPHYMVPRIELGGSLLVAGTVMACGVFFGLLPALAGGKVNLRGTFQSGGRGGSEGRGTVRSRQLLVALEVSLALAILIGTNLILKSADRQRRFHPGYRVDNVATLHVQLDRRQWARREDRIRFFRRVQEEVGALPGLSAVSLVSRLPSDYDTSPVPLFVEGNEISGTGRIRPYLYRICEGSYFSTMGIPLVDGRVFDERDEIPGAPRVAVVSEAAAREYWPGESALGRRLDFSESAPADGDWIEVVGVVGDTRNLGNGRAVEPGIYLPLFQETTFRYFLTAITSSPPQGHLHAMMEATRIVDPTVSTSLARTLKRAVQDTYWEIRFYAWIFGIFSVIALVLTATGVYGVMAYSVSRRKREFAIRIAVGAPVASVQGRAVLEGLSLALAGALVGVGGARLGTRFMASLLYRVDPTDLWVYGGSVAMMMGLALVATYLPCRDLGRQSTLQSLGAE